MILFDWLFQDEFLFKYIAANLVEMVSTKGDRFITLGWCTFVRGVLEHERAMYHYPMNGIKQSYIDLLKMLFLCIPHLLILEGKRSETNCRVNKNLDFQQRVPYTNQVGALIDIVNFVGEKLIAANLVGSTTGSRESI